MGKKKNNFHVGDLFLFYGHGLSIITEVVKKNHHHLDGTYSDNIRLHRHDGRELTFSSRYIYGAIADGEATWYPRNPDPAEKTN